VRQITTVLVAVLGASLVLAAAAGAKDGDVLRAGTCTQASTSKLKLGPEDGGIEVEFEVDQNRNGVRWKVVVVRNGSVVASRTRVTRGPSGSFELELVTRNVAGTDRFVARATRAGETCTARAAIA
jgi:hypothetical protein